MGRSITQTHSNGKFTFASLMKWLRISARVFSFWAVNISLTSQKLTWKQQSQQEERPHSVRHRDHKKVEVKGHTFLSYICTFDFRHVESAEVCPPSSREERTWLNLHVKATTLGARLCFSFLFHPQLASSWNSGENSVNQQARGPEVRPEDQRSGPQRPPSNSC